MSSIDKVWEQIILGYMGSAALDPLSNKAVEAALNNNWTEAISINTQLLKKYPKDVEAINRLARAYYESGKLTKAKSTYKLSLKIDPYNPIATKNLKKLSDLKENNITHSISNGNGANATISDLFLEEPGRTKIIQVENLKSKRLISQLRTADLVTLKNKYNNVSVYSASNKEIGTLDSIWGKKIASCIRNGFKFEAYIVNADLSGKVSIFIREVFRPKKLSNHTVFPIEKMDDFRPYVSEEALSLITTETKSQNTEEESTTTHTENNPHTSLESLAQKEQEAMDQIDEEN